MDGAWVNCHAGRQGGKRSGGGECAAAPTVCNLSLSFCAAGPMILTASRVPATGLAAPQRARPCRLHAAASTPLTVCTASRGPSRADGGPSKALQHAAAAASAVVLAGAVALLTPGVAAAAGGSSGLEVVTPPASSTIESLDYPLKYPGQLEAPPPVEKEPGSDAAQARARRFLGCVTPPLWRLTLCRRAHAQDALAEAPRLPPCPQPCQTLRELGESLRSRLAEAADGIKSATEHGILRERAGRAVDSVEEAGQQGASAASQAVGSAAQGAKALLRSGASGVQQAADEAGKAATEGARSVKVRHGAAAT